MKYVCTICEWVYDEDIEEINFQDEPDSYKCPICGAGKEVFEMVDE